MDKKEFFEPEVKVVELDDRCIVCASSGDDVSEGLADED